MYEELWSLIDQESVAYQAYLSAKRGQDIGRVRPSEVKRAKAFWYVCLDARLHEAQRIGAKTGQKASAVIRDAYLDRLTGRAKVKVKRGGL